MTLDRDLVAAALPAYELGAELGRGGWGVVLQARHRQLGREVAVKQLPRAFAADPAVRARFVAEARLLAGFDHPHIVPVYDFVEADGLCLLVMEKLPGGTVWSRFVTDGMTMVSACGITLAACAALEFAHAKGVLHRDIKPENLIFSGEEVLKVTDFGIAKVVGGGQTLATRAGEVLGTPAYMAPEQAQAKELSPATDVYATGTMLYELLAGRLPFPDDGDALAVVFRHVYEQPTPLVDVAPNVPAPVADVVMRAIATDPAERYQSAEAFGLALAEAATAAWKPGWLAAGQMNVMSSTAIAAVTERASAPRRAPETVAAAPPPSDATPTSPVPIPAPPTEVTPPPPAPVPAPPTEKVRPASAAPRGGGRLEDIDAADLVPVKEVLPRPSSPAPLLLAALALVLATIVLALAGLGSPDYKPAIPGLAVNGTPAGTDPIELDLAEPVLVTGSAAGAARVTIRFSVAGVPLSSAAATAEPGDGGTFTATLEPTGARYLVAGEVTATVDVDGTEATFPVSSAQSPFLTVPGLLGIGLLLFVAAYAESLLRSRRRGRKRVTAPVGMAVIGALGGVAAVVAVWLVAAKEPVVATVVACAALGAGAGVVAVAAAARSAKLRRFRRRAQARARA
jgi:hypothetical protein